MPRFIWLTAIAVDAPTIEEANAILEEAYGTDCWNETPHDAISVWSPAGEPTDIEEDAHERVCTCPPDLVARGGFRGGCPVHGAT
jgi:hypothetical protein